MDPEQREVWRKITAGTASEGDHAKAFDRSEEYFQRRKRRRSSRPSSRLYSWYREVGIDLSSSFATRNKRRFDQDGLSFLANFMTADTLIRSGGLEHYLACQEGAFLVEVYEFCLEVDKVDYAEIFQRALGVFGEVFAADHAERAKIAAQYSSSLAEISTLYFRLRKSEGRRALDFCEAFLDAFEEGRESGSS